MKLKYRIKEYTFPFAPKLFAVQYRIFGLWMYINHNITGNFIFKSSCYFYSKEEAEHAIQLHKDNGNRAKDWWIKGKNIYRVD